ncbi:ArdC-like ssDNA-binding domain-containing protein [Jatrophihabitans cynanchi]|uniref:ArdC-like ssDNA-binding domain-containing protein n=1 Tax=Jatrophihabitans cynanchi TaxID=2944128 RepID=A0ABY7JRE8_9ACTN|nr:ArdC family protein [Jatrophihabitans sp. SB3-54]WAX55137.1 ArdC-like ssDNA-binding domain-containing protein [Jatrophihabitans sp. SB3-54]
MSREEAAAARAERIDAAQAVLADAVAGIRDGDGWQRFLAFQAKLHAYSANNCLLITAQHLHKYEQGLVPSPLPTYVASYRRWQDLGRQVQRGQSGMAIVAPMRGFRREAVDADGNTRRLAGDERPDAGEQETKTAYMRGFTVEKVFSMEQTDGDPLPLPPAPHLLTGQAPPGLSDAVTRLVESRGFAVSTVASAVELGGANGRTTWSDRTVKIRADMDDAARVKTLIHEVAHVLLHDPTTDETGAGLPTGHKEVEAESVAFVVADAHGMATGEYSFAYVAGWIDREDHASVIAKTAQRVAACAKQIIAASPAAHTDGGRPTVPERPVSRPAELALAEREAVGL